MRRPTARIAALAAVAAALAACNNSGDTATNVETPAEDIAATPNEGWINIEGTVVSTTPRAFILDYGNGRITVEMDDWDWFQEGRALNPGDRVSVTGRVDRDLFERAAIEAGSVFVHNLGTFFYASSGDEEGVGASTVYQIAPAGAVDATGSVTAIEGREFTVGTANGSMRVDTSRMRDNPLDQEGNPQIRLADRVYVWGSLDVDPRERAELMADGLIVLRPDRTRSARSADSGSGADAGASANVSAGNVSAENSSEANVAIGNSAG